MTQRPGWLYDELAHAGAEHLDPGYVLTYDRKADTDPSEDLTALRGLGLDTTSTVVDLGTGTGTFALAVAPLCRRVVAVDVSPAMLGALSARAERLGITNVEPVRAGFLTYEHHGEPADFVYSRNALHHLPDLWKAIALDRVASLLRPGGVLRLRDLIFSFEPGEMDRFIDGWLASAAGRPEEGWTRTELEAHLQEEHSTFSWLLEPMLERSGFEIRATEYSASKIYAAYTCVRRQ